MPAALRKLIVHGLWLMVIFYLTPVALAQEGLTKDTYRAPEHSAYTTLNLQTAAIPCAIIGTPLMINQKCPGYDQTGTLSLYDQLPDGGALGGLNNIMIAVYSHPPTSTAAYLANLGENLGLVKPAYAQNIGGAGAGVIQPILKLWQFTRNLSYLAFIAVFIIIGFMIMFRTKVNPQTVISAQAALPGLVIGLILVTFSYFIAALIIDASFVGMRLVALIFQQSGLTNIIADPNEVAVKSSIFNLFGSFVWNGNLLQFFPDVAGLFGNIGVQLNPVGDIPIIGHITSALLGAVMGVAGGLVGVLVILVLLIALLIQMFRLIWALVSSYIAIFVVTILGPVIILVSSIPGRGGLLGMWWKTLLANALVFPAVFAAFLFAGVFLGSTDSQEFQVALPLFAGLPTGILRLIIAYGIILGTPKIPEMVKQALGAKGPEGIAQAALGGAMGGLAVGGAGYGAATQRYSEQAEAYYRAEATSRATGAALPAGHRWYYPLLRRRGGR